MQKLLKNKRLKRKQLAMTLKIDYEKFDIFLGKNCFNDGLFKFKADYY